MSQEATNTNDDTNWEEVYTEMFENGAGGASIQGVLEVRGGLTQDESRALQYAELLTPYRMRPEDQLAFLGFMGTQMQAEEVLSALQTNANAWVTMYMDHLDTMVRTAQATQGQVQAAAGEDDGNASQSDTVTTLGADDHSEGTMVSEAVSTQSGEE